MNKIDEQLLLAITSRSDTIALQLIESGANIDAIDNEGNSMLMQALQEGSDLFTVIPFMLTHGADHAIANVSGDTPLMYVARNSFPNPLSDLLRAGADPFVVGNKGHSALWYVFESSRSDMVSYFSQYLDRIDSLITKNESVERLSDLLYLVIESLYLQGRSLSDKEADNCLSAARVLIEAGADISADGGKVIFSASSLRNIHKAFMELMIESGADVNIKDRGGLTPIMHSCIKRSEDIFEVILRGGGDINAKDKNGMCVSQYVNTFVKLNDDKFARFQSIMQSYEINESIKSRHVMTEDITPGL